MVLDRGIRDSRAEQSGIENDEDLERSLEEHLGEAAAELTLTTFG